MQYLNDDMDELARRAAEDYPLDTSGANWDKVKSSMQQSVASKKGKTNWLWLIPVVVFWISNTFIAYRQGFGDGKLYTDKQNNSTNNNAISKSKSNLVSNSAPLIVLRKQDPSKETNLVDQRPVLIPASHELIFKPAAGLRISKSIAQNKSIKKSEVSIEKISDVDNSEFNYLKDAMETTHSYTPLTLTALSVSPRLPIVTINNNEQSTLQHKSRSKSTKSLYGAILVGSDMNTVKMQTLSKPGITAGIKIGFQLNKWGLETGLLYDKKSYSSDGKYFNYKLYPNTKINNVSGTCNMFEWPIDIHYVFNPTGKHTFYVSGGLSSYVMKKENYTYDYDWYGQSYYSNRTYNNSSQNFFSIINISAGYQVKVGRTSSLRFEPYGKLPVKGVGIGGLPLTSFGVNLVVSKNFLQQ